MLFYHTSKERTRLVTLDEAALALVDTWHKQAEYGVHKKLRYTYQFTSNTVSFTYGNCYISASFGLDYSQKERSNKVSIEALTMNTQERVSLPFELLSLHKEHVRMTVKGTAGNFEDISIPWSSINEFDFFQYETLGVICPFSASTLTKLTNCLKEPLYDESATKSI